MTRVVDPAQLRNLRREIEQANGDWLQSVAAGLYEAGWAILDESQELVPVLTGTLKASGNVEQRSDRTGVRVLVSYGGPAVAYARYQHEGEAADGTRKVRRYSEPGKSKHYLRIPLEREVAAWPRGLIARIRRTSR